MTIVVERTSRLGAPAPEVWRHATSMAGINRELAPIGMSHPPDRDTLDADVPLGQPLFTSVLRLGPVPFDRHRLTLAALDWGVGFQEDSTSLLHRRWRHRRTVTPLDADTCEVHDHLEVVPRLPGASAPTRWLVGRVFDRRHQVLRTTFPTA